MISANNVTLRVGKKALFEDVNIKFTEGNCYGLIGANGAGKSTFLKILSGQLEPTNGDVVITPGQRLSFLQQDHFKYDEYQVLDTVIMGNKICLQSQTWDFDHDTDLNLWIIGNPLLLQCIHDLSYRFLCLADILHTAYHGKHDL